jgi:hypothetical protein
LSFNAIAPSSKENYKEDNLRLESVMNSAEINKSLKGSKKSPQQWQVLKSKEMSAS